MPPGASNCAPTSADGRTSSGGSLPGGGFAVLGSCPAGFCTTLLVAVLLAAGCGSSIPRFMGEHDAPLREEDETRHAERIRMELATEDDHPVRPDSVASVLGAPGTAGMDPQRERLITEVVSYIGVPYRRGGTTRRGFDCSGFVSTVFAGGAGLALPRSTRAQFDAGPEVPRPELRFGDLVFFNTTGAVPSHVGIYLEEDLFAHASLSEGVTFSSLESSYYRKRFVGARRVLAD